MVLDKQLYDRINNAKQADVLKFWNQLSEIKQQHFANQLCEVQWENLPELISRYVTEHQEISIPENLEPAEYFPLHPQTPKQAEYYLQAEARGDELFRTGRVCCLTVAGGQGTRLGYDGPKGTYPIGPVTGRSLFAYFAQTIRRAELKYGNPFSWYIMTSPANHQDTINYFNENSFFGLSQEQVFFFTQGTMPAIGYDGKLLLASTGSLALSPDGHGGTLLALQRSGALDRMKREGTDIISYFQVDNPLAPIFSKRFIGLHDLEHSEMSAISLTKTGPFEKLGNFCVASGRTQIIEYSDLPNTLAEQRKDDGSLLFAAGSPAIHVLSIDFIERLTVGGTLQLPWHRADKKINCIDINGNPVKPVSPNGVKLESFIFDALPLANRVMLLEGDRSEVFAPTKNPSGVDSVESCREMLINRDARRLSAAGVAIPRNDDNTVAAKIEISPLAAIDDADVADYVKKHAITQVAFGDNRCFE